MKNKKTATLLAIFLGLLGIHQFYLGKNIRGLFYFLTCGLCGILWALDVITLVFISQNDFDNKYNSQNIQRQILKNIKK
tara:strand:- start:2 stop:238 length:237 start_codon:yes stop_codon:yes gene_type:complete